MPRAKSLRTYLRRHYGRTTSLASQLGVSVALVSLWADRKRTIPVRYCRQLTELTGVPLHLLRPDLARFIKKYVEILTVQNRKG